MDDSFYGKTVRKYVDDHYSMRSSNDNDRSDPVGLSSLGVVDVFGLRAFDSGSLSLGCYVDSFRMNFVC